MGNEIETQILETAQDQQLTEDARRRAAATPLPGALGELLATGEIVIDAATRVRRVVAADWKIFQAINSPIVQMLLESQKDEKIRDEVKFNVEEEWELCWQFTHEILDVLFAIGIDDEDDRAEWLEMHDKLPAKGSRENFRRISKKEIGRFLSINKTAKIMSAVVRQFAASNETKIGFENGDGDGSKKN